MMDTFNSWGRYLALPAPLVYLSTSWMSNALMPGRARAEVFYTGKGEELVLASIRFGFLKRDRFVWSRSEIVVCYGTRHKKYTYVYRRLVCILHDLYVHRRCLATSESSKIIVLKKRT